MKYLSLFSGIGGFEYGIQNSKYKDELICIGYSEIDKYANSIYRKQFPSKMVKGICTHTPLGDVTKIRTSDLQDFELLVGGFPCQAFSNAGLRRGFDDTRGTLFFEIARILKDKRPRYFLLENVKGLLYHQKGETFKRILEVFAELGYYVKWEVLNSKNYGVPQSRERVYIKGYFGEECGGEVLSFSSPNGEVTEKMNAYTSPTRNCKLINTDSICGTLTSKCKDSGANTLVLEENDNYVKIKNGTKKGYLYAEEEEDGILINRPSCNSRRGRVQKKKCGTLDTGASWGVYDNSKIRRLTPVESELLQGFPRNWTKYGVNDELISDTQRYKCIGNAVTTNVITHIFNNWDLYED